KFKYEKSRPAFPIKMSLEPLGILTTNGFVARTWVRRCYIRRHSQNCRDPAKSNNKSCEIFKYLMYKIYIITRKLWIAQLLS
ncbi:MAG: hypothetical protein ACTSVI_14150, partial [Promethearchaeota archaeon]